MRRIFSAIPITPCRNSGSGGVCFGSDFFGTDDLPSDVQNFEQEEKMRALFLAAGYCVSDTEKIFRENLQNFLAKNCR